MIKSRFKNFKYFVLASAFLVTAILTFLSINYKLELPISTTMDVATLPIVEMQTQNGTLFNELHGYITDVDASLLNDSITPLPDDKKLSIVINNYGENVTKLSYKIRKLDDMSLIEDTVVTDYASDGQNINAKLNIKNLIENDIEYLLEINIVTDNNNQIKYFTKIISSPSIDLQAKIDFAMNFNSCTFDQSKLDNIKGLLETNKLTGDNSNFGKVNINSTLAQIGWGSLNPTVEKTIIPTIKDINNEVASIYLEYTMAAQGTTGAYDTYIVQEYYRIRQTATTMYLLNFEREANQVFNGINDLSQKSSISLGITSDENVDMKSSPKGDYACFVSQGSLWCFNDKEKAFTRIFSFEAEDSDNRRELYDKHNIKITNVEDNGNVNFIVYGYMNRGAHEGEVGVSLCSYNYEDNQVKELLYVPVNVPYDELKENVGQVAYISENNIFYFLLDNSLYSIDLTSKEVMVEISGLSDETYAISGDGKSIAYSINGKLNDTDVIRVFNMSSGGEYQIRADEGDRLKILGYIKTDCIIGVAHKSDVLIENNGFVTFPMYCLNIYDSEFNIIKKYQNDGIFVNSATISGLRINLTRVVKNADGFYESIAIDQLMNRDENQTGSGLSIETDTTDTRKKELYINLVNKISNTDNVSIRTSKEVVFVSSKSVKVDAEFKDSGRYFVYGFGKFQGSFTNLSTAIANAYDTYGTIVDNNANYIWKRYKNSTGALTNKFSGGVGDSASLGQSVKLLLHTAGFDVDVSAKLSQGMTALDIINEATSNRALNLKGVSLENVLYYTSVGIPVVGRTGDNSYVIVTSFDTKNITYFEVSTGKEVILPTADASKVFTQFGNVFIAYKG